MAFYNNKNHTHAFATVLGTMGGFQAQPEWFTSLSESSVWQILMATVLVYQGGGNLDIVYSLCVAIALSDRRPATTVPYFFACSIKLICP